MSTAAFRRLFTLVAALCASLLIVDASAQRMPGPDPDDGKTFRVISLHDIRENVRESFMAAPEPTALDERTLSEFFAWLQQSGHSPVSLQQIVDARTGGKPLPPQAVLLTFDDGYASAFTKVFPLLKQYRFPAVMALVTEWLEVPAGQSVSGYNVQNPPLREAFMTWAQAREMAASGLVELASHTHAMHTGIKANLQGNLQPAAASLAYDERTGRYESHDAYITRIEADMRQSRALIEKRTGARVRTLVWPYGAYTEPALAAARRAGMPIAMTLEEGPNTADIPLSRMRRGLATYDMPIPDYTLFRAPAGQGSIFPINRAMHIDLDYVYDADPVQQEANLSKLLDRVLAVGPASVFLQAYADPDGDGVADAMYFPNRHLPMRADLFNRVAWQLRTRTGVQVYAWMPVMAFHLPAGHPLANRRVMWASPHGPMIAGSVPAGGQAVQTVPAGVNRYDRLTPFDPEVRALIGDIYEDLGRHAMIAGVLFHDDAMLGDDEDVSQQALRTYADWGLPGDIDAIKANPQWADLWARKKTAYLTDFTLELAARTRQWRPGILTARNLYALPVMRPETESWFAQNYAQSLAAYDYTAVMAMPYMENVADPQAWLAQMMRRVAATPLGLDKTVMEIQARDWRTNQPIADATLAAQWSLLHRMGARHLAYYPDDFHNNQPDLATVRNAISVRANLQDRNDGLDTPPSLTPARPIVPIFPIDNMPTDRSHSPKAAPR